METTLSLFLPAVERWFQRALGQPTPVQRQGWPVIAAGQNALLLAPTGSGKTLAAFLACLDGLWRQTPIRRGVQVLYISPLKALNNDIYRNLQVPLEGVAAEARALGPSLPTIDVAVRTGDTPTAERLKLLRHPPHVLITTPESLHLLLTSRARETLRGVTHCIVDEIHALCPNKRGVFLSLLLERLQELNPAGFARIGLSATQRPLDEVARYLGGFQQDQAGNFVQRPVTIVDAGLRKHLDLRVVSPVEQFGPLPEKTIWPSIYRLLAQEIRRHRSTIVFANNRRTVERITAQLQELFDSGSVAPQEHNVVFPDEKAEAIGPLVKAHHGSVSLEVRQDTERALKEGRLQAVVATASLELGIDMGAVDLVCQVESTGNVARALQRVGRAGHLVGQQSKGRLIPKTLADLVDQAVLAAEMAAGQVEELRVPRNCLDVLAQQVVAMVAMEPWDVAQLFALVRRAYPFRDLTPKAFDAVLEMVTGRYRFTLPEAEEGPPQVNPRTQLAALQPRISWDRVHQKLEALPGSQRLAILNGGTIPDTGQFAVVTGAGLRVGDVDEEFVWERRAGDAFLLGTNAWRIDGIDTDRVRVVPADGAPALIPFWRGENTGRSYDLGAAQGAFLRRAADRLDAPDFLDWLQTDHFLDAAAARSLRDYLRRQLQRSIVPTDRTLVVEAARDPMGDWQVILLSPWGNRVHFTLRLALENILRQRLGYRPQCLHHDDGVLIRFTESDEPVLDLFAGLTPENLEALVLDELADSALFAQRFRQNAARAMLLPRGQANRRAPFWLQRLRGRDLLQVARRFPDFPILAETFRECLHDHLEVPRVKELLGAIQAGAIQVKTCRLEAPSPFAAGLIFQFQAAQMYIYDDTEAEPSQGYTRLDQELLDHLVGSQGKALPLDPRAVRQVQSRLRGVGRPPRTKAETAEWLRRLGDIAPDELEGAAADLLLELETEGRVKQVHLARTSKPERWILTEDEPSYAQVFGGEPAAQARVVPCSRGGLGIEQAEPREREEAAARILFRFLETHALVGLQDVLDRYPFDKTWAKRMLQEWARSGRVKVVQSPATPETVQWSAPANYEQIQRGTLAIMRREVTTCPAPQFAAFLARWQNLHPQTRGRGAEALAKILDRLEDLHVPAELWEQALLPARLTDYQPRWLDETLAGGEWAWIGRGGDELGAGSLALVRRETLASMRPPELDTGPDDAVQRVLECLQARGALFLVDLATATGLSPNAARAALWTLVRQGLVTNDHFDVVRRGEEKFVEPEHEMAAVGRGRRPGTHLLRPRSAGRRAGPRPEGRWSLVAYGPPDPEAQAFFQARLLLRRYGIVARELALLDPMLPPWRVLYEVLSRMELVGEVRRGYMVEGLSGAQFALPEAIGRLQELSLPADGGEPALLINSLDPANLYGAGAPLDMPLIAGGTKPFLRRPSNWLVQIAGKPVLLVELQGKRLTALASARPAQLTQAVALLPGILSRNQIQNLRRKLTVETWNEEPVTGTAGKDLLEAAGFVRDYQAMTLYAAWHPADSAGVPASSAGLG